MSGVGIAVGCGVDWRPESPWRFSRWETSVSDHGNIDPPFDRGRS